MSFSSEDEKMHLELATALSLTDRLERQSDSSEDENVQLEIAKALSLTDGVGKAASEELSDSDDSDSGEAYGQFHHDNNQDLELALAISKSQEEEDLKTAIDLSKAALQEDEDFRSLLMAQQLELYEPTGNQHHGLHRALPLVELQEQLLEWSENTPEEVNYDVSVGGDSDDDLPSRYKNYRLVPTLFSESEMWPPNAISQQLRELRLSRGLEEIREWQESQCESDRCLVCLTNVATRIAVPCGHKLCCRSCLPSLTDKARFYSVTTADGEVQPTDRRMPVQCFTCRAIIGQIVTLR